MPPRKSISRAAGAPGSTVAGSSTSKSTQNHASSSKLSVSLPPISVPETVTPTFKRQKLEHKTLEEEDRDILIHELVGFYPRKLCDVVQEVARQNVYDTVGQIEAWAQIKTGGLSDEYRMEVDIGLHSLETLLESQVDKAFDKFTGWTLRNGFDAPAELELVLPWHKDLDFERGEHIASLPGGESSILTGLDDLRRKVEQSRYLSQQLERAGKLLDRRIEIMNQRKSEIGFIAENISNANLHPLAPKSQTLKQNLLSLQTLLSPMEDPHPSVPPPSGKGTNLKAWEMGRQAYLSWAVNKAVGSSGGIGAGVGAVDEMSEVEKEAEGQGGIGGVETMMRAVSSSAGVGK